MRHGESPSPVLNHINPKRGIPPYTLDERTALGVVCDILTQLSDAKQSELRNVIKFISFSRDQVCSAVEDRTTTGQT